MIPRPVAPQRHRTDRRSQSVVAAAARLHEVSVQPLIGADGSIGARAGPPNHGVAPQSAPALISGRAGC